MFLIFNQMLSIRAFGRRARDKMWLIALGSALLYKI